MCPHFSRKGYTRNRAPGERGSGPERGFEETSAGIGTGHDLFLRSVVHAQHKRAWSLILIARPGEIPYCVRAVFVTLPPVNTAASPGRLVGIGGGVGRVDFEIRGTEDRFNLCDCHALAPALNPRFSPAPFWSVSLARMCSLRPCGVVPAQVDAEPRCRHLRRAATR